MKSYCIGYKNRAIHKIVLEFPSKELILNTLITFDKNGAIPKVEQAFPSGELILNTLITLRSNISTILHSSK